MFAKITKRGDKQIQNHWNVVDNLKSVDKKIIAALPACAWQQTVRHWFINKWPPRVKSFDRHTLGLKFFF